MGATRTGFADRVLGAALLRDAIYEEIEADRGATPQAALVVVLGAIAAGVGSGARLGFIGFLVIVLVALAGWSLYATLTYWLGTGILKGPNTRADLGEVARTLGFANGPAILLVLDLLGVDPLVDAVVFIWILVTTVVALRAALDVSTGRAAAIALTGWVVALVLRRILIALQIGGGEG